MSCPATGTSGSNPNGVRHHRTLLLSFPKRTVGERLSRRVIAGGRSVAEALARGKTATLSEFGVSALPTVAAFQVVGPGDHHIAARSGGRRISERSAQ